ncbi:Structural maintenance of chromosomes protein 5, partial [Spiromyces aspiralis]
MKNFVTYDRCELYPGPYFNMVIGPNGTGKSTIVCAIALGLGGSPSLLGRAKDVSEFVKHGHESGWVEITLRGMSPSSTTTIRRQFSRSSNKTSWKLDGQPASKAEVHRVIQGFNIQVDNLCQFLPQDRVVEFSKMTSQKLLLNTQTAVGRGDLHDLQSGLIQYRQKEVSLLNEAKQLMEDEATLAHQNSIIKRDVQRWQEREQAERQVRVLKLQIPLARYAAAKAGYEESRQRRREAQARFARLQQESGPAVEMINQMRAKALELETKQRRLREELREHDRGFR